MIKNKTIFIIDDDPITVFGITRMLKGHIVQSEISTYQNGKLAIDSLKTLLHENKELPQIILLDINMPIMDGWQFLEEFITLPIRQKINIHIITSSIDPADLQKSEMFKHMTTHSIDFKNKPIRKEDIQQITSIY
ncbi:response regulator [Arenibacter sp. GZD96]|uniref:response regulator n=1 Tax=Aurantibrevibacter litoralis TaxID=3106030 RepID=UPI002AFF8359|nr:response regulator [Arenibacter sp. GZD-96]MEA1786845.1 response regulator [Arenibacter sp. GZD-96]